MAELGNIRVRRVISRSGNTNDGPSGRGSRQDEHRRIRRLGRDARQTAVERRQGNVVVSRPGLGRRGRRGGGSPQEIPAGRKVGRGGTCGGAGRRHLFLGVPVPVRGTQTLASARSQPAQDPVPDERAKRAKIRDPGVTSRSGNTKRAIEQIPMSDSFFVYILASRRN